MTLVDQCSHRKWLRMIHGTHSISIPKKIQLLSEAQNRFGTTGLQDTLQCLFLVFMPVRFLADEMVLTDIYAFPGRSIPVIGGNVSKAMSGLALRLKLNNVAGTWRYQMRHEKKGVKRRRLSSERWRRRFSDEVRLFSISCSH